MTSPLRSPQSGRAVSPKRPSFEKGKPYHRNALLQSLAAEDTKPLYVLHRVGKVLAFTLNRWQNPNAPTEILVGYEESREHLANSFIKDRPEVPVFIREQSDSKDWFYHGQFRLKAWTDEPAEKNKRVKHPDIPGIYKILFLEELPL